MSNNRSSKKLRNGQVSASEKVVLREEGGRQRKGKGSGVRPGPRAVSPKPANAAVHATESYWAEDQDGDDDSDQSQLPSPTR